MPTEIDNIKQLRDAFASIVIDYRNYRLRKTEAAIDIDLAIAKADSLDFDGKTDPLVNILLQCKKQTEFVETSKSVHMALFIEIVKMLNTMNHFPQFLTERPGLRCELTFAIKQLHALNHDSGVTAYRDIPFNEQIYVLTATVSASGSLMSLYMSSSLTALGTCIREQLLKPLKASRDFHEADEIENVIVRKLETIFENFEKNLKLAARAKQQAALKAEMAKTSKQVAKLSAATSNDGIDVVAEAAVLPVTTTLTKGQGMFDSAAPVTAVDSKELPTVGKDKDNKKKGWGLGSLFRH